MKEKHTTTDWVLLLVNAFEKPPKYSIRKESNKFAKKLDLIPNEIGTKNQAVEVAKKTTTTTKKKKHKERIKNRE